MSSNPILTGSEVKAGKVDQTGFDARAWLSAWEDAGGIIIHRMGGFSLLMPSERVTQEARQLRVRALAPGAICALLAYLDDRQNGEVRR